jgi:HAD superfamily hydrolase (TIGR01549 family)
MYKGILLDIDNTLYPYRTTHEKALETCYKHLSQVLLLDQPSLHEAYLYSRQKVKQDLGGTAASHNRLLYFQHMMEYLKVSPIQHAMHAYNLYWDAFLENIVLFPGVLDFFQAMKDRRICFLTDLTAHIQYRKISSMGLNGFVHDIVTSEEAGYDKPHKLMFEKGLAKLGLRPSEVCMIGDNYEKDVLGACSLGIAGFWMNWKNEKTILPPTCRSLNNFNELSEALS